MHMRFAFLVSILFLGLLSTPNAQAGAFSGGYWWANCPATATFPAITGNTNGSAYQAGLGPLFDTGTLSLQSVFAYDANTFVAGTLLTCSYSDKAINTLLIYSPVDYPYCRATGSFGWFQCHQ